MKEFRFPSDRRTHPCISKASLCDLSPTGPLSRGEKYAWKHVMLFMHARGVFSNSRNQLHRLSKTMPFNFFYYQNTPHGGRTIEVVLISILFIEQKFCFKLSPSFWPFGWLRKKRGSLSRCCLSGEVRPKVEPVWPREAVWRSLPKINHLFH